MRRYVIEREIKNIGDSTPRQFCDAATTSNRALAELGTDIQWVQSYVVADRTFCIYLAKDEEIIRRHAEISGFPATRIHEVVEIIDPTTATRPVPV